MFDMALSILHVFIESVYLSIQNFLRKTLILSHQLTGIRPKTTVISATRRFLLRLNAFPLVAKLEAVYQMTDNETIKFIFKAIMDDPYRQALGYGNEFNSKILYLLWNSKIYLITTRIKVPVYLRLLIEILADSRGIHVHDGPGILSKNMNRGNSFIYLSTFQAFVMIYRIKGESTEKHVDAGVKYYARKVQHFNISVSTSQVSILSPCTSQMHGNMEPLSAYVTRHQSNKHCVYNLAANSGYLNLSVKNLRYTGPNFYRSGFGTTNKFVLYCLQGGLAYEIEYDKKKDTKTMYQICSNYTSEPNVDISKCKSNISRSMLTKNEYHKSMMNIISSTQSMILVVYSYEHYSEVSFNISVMTTNCKGMPNYGGK